MAEYIKREAALAICEEEYREQLRILNYAGDSVAWNIGHAIKELPAADVDPVVRCKDCKHSWEDIGGLCCSHGVCVDCEVPSNFYCAYGKRRAEKEPPEEGET